MALNKNRRIGFPRLYSYCSDQNYYYLVMHPNTQHGLDLRRSDGKRFRVEACPKLKERFPDSFQYVISFPSHTDAIRPARPHVAFSNALLSHTSFCM